jgi:hypothetical protein
MQITPKRRSGPTYPGFMQCHSLSRAKLDPVDVGKSAAQYGPGTTRGKWSPLPTDREELIHYDRCHACKAQFTVTVGTAMEDTHLPLQHWYLAMYLMMSTAKPISALSLSRQMGIQYRTCWHLLHRLRAMLTSGATMPLAGIIEADETYVGGKARNRQKHRLSTTRGRGTDKPMVFAAVERGGTARTHGRCRLRQCDGA